MTNITTPFAGTEDRTTFQTRITAIAEAWGGTGALSGVTTFGGLRTVLNTYADAANDINGSEVASSFIGKLNWLNNRDNLMPYLFGVSGQGILFDASRMATLFQDSAGSTPVTAAGQPVGRVLDLSGRGNHLLQAVSAARPTLIVDGGGKQCLSLDGVDDWLSAASVSWGGSDEVTIVSAVQVTPTAVQSAIVQGGGTLSPSGFLQVKLTDNKIRTRSGGSVAVTTDTPAAVTGSVEVFSTVAKIGAPSVVLRRNAVQVAVNTASQGTGTFPTSTFSVASVGGGQFLAGNFYALLAINRRLTASELQQAEMWAAAKAGVTL